MYQTRLIKISGTLFVMVTLFLGGLVASNSTFVGSSNRKDEIQAGIILNKGYKLYEDGRYQEAIIVWNQVKNNYQGTTSWPKAVFNIGLAYEQMELYGRAIEYFTMILKAKVDNKEPGQCVMEAYRNYHHKACMEISWCYKVTEDYERALEYAILGRDVYRYESWCGTCMSIHMKWIDDEIRYLGLMKEWVKEKKTACSFECRYELYCSDQSMINIIMPYFNSTDGTTDHFWSYTKVSGGEANISITDSIHGMGLNVSFMNNCTITVAFEMPYAEQDQGKMLDGITLIKDGRYWIYLDPVDEDTIVMLKMEVIWIRYLSPSEFMEWGTHYPVEIDDGWDYYYLYGIW